ncbi:phage tail protein [Insolitispirillum peregrinum]|uniref:phage tail protein n=1 Tax=Insolitispirillum peregrinum TaxID=80876 RepID=UPI00360782EA
MSESFLGEISLFAFGKKPAEWTPCEGQILQIQSNAALYSLLGVYYGGDGRTTFALPDLRGRVVVGYGRNPPSYSIMPGQIMQIGTAGQGGSEGVTLTTAQIPPHNHQFNATTLNPAASGAIAGAILGTCQRTTTTPTAAPNPPNYYAPGSNNSITSLAAASLLPSGGDQAHENRQPYLALQYCICTSGIYPPREW